MKAALNETQQGLRRASAQVTLASSRIARWGTQSEAGAPPASGPEPDTLTVEGADRPRETLRQRWDGRGPDGLSPEVDLTEEAIRLKAGEWAFRANIAATRSVLDMQKSASQLLDDHQAK